MDFRKELLHSDELQYSYTDRYEDCLHAHGLYNSMRFVVRLSPVNHEYIDEITKGNVRDLSSEAIQAYSTYLHETVHWWQHIGSTLGLIISLSYPAQTHRNVEGLRKILGIIGPKKSIDIYNKNNATEVNPSTDEFHHINIILNNFHDIEFFRSIILNPKSVITVSKSGYFESVGHSYNLGYSSALLSLAEVFDRDFKLFPNPDNWISEFEKLKKKKVKGYYYGSENYVPALGLKEILEGQARFIQLQFLSFSSDNKITWSDFAAIGFLDGIYFKAFQFYLDASESEIPDSIDHPIVALFLLVCDISINPGEGFPFDIEHFESFIKSVDPGIRFNSLCHAIKKHPEVKKMINDYSKKEYEEVAEILCKEIVSHTPSQVCKEALGWIENSKELEKLLEEESEFDFKNENQPVRIILSKYLKFCNDKVEHPEFFCWPGAWKAGGRAKELHEKLWLSHLSLFMDKKGDKGIYPREFPDAPKENIYDTFNNFYAWNIMYNLTRQWIFGEGAFNYDYSWLSEKYDSEELKKYADDIFKNAYGEYPDNFEILTES